jgi:hypothetical protein
MDPETLAGTGRVSRDVSAVPVGVFHKIPKAPGRLPRKSELRGKPHDIRTLILAASTPTGASSGKRPRMEDEFDNIPDADEAANEAGDQADAGQQSEGSEASDADAEKQTTEECTSVAIIPSFGPIAPYKAPESKNEDGELFRKIMELELNRPCFFNKRLGLICKLQSRARTSRSQKRATQLDTPKPNRRTLRRHEAAS